MYYKVLGRKVWMLPIGQFGKFTLPLRLPQKRMHYLKEATIWINHYWSKAFEELFSKKRDVVWSDAPRLGYTSRSFFQKRRSV